MSVPTDTAVANARSGWGALGERLRESTSTLDVAFVGAVSLILGLIRLGAPSLWFDEAYTFRQINKG